MTDAEIVVSQLLEYALMPEAQFRFVEYKWMANMAGYGYPVDVHYGDDYLGVAEVQQAHVEIFNVKFGSFSVRINKTPSNRFRTLQDAAQAMLRFYQQNQEKYVPQRPLDDGPDEPDEAA